MFSSDDLDWAKTILTQMGLGKSNNSNKRDKNGINNKDDDNSNNGDQNCINLTPSQLLVIAGFLAGVLDVNSVLVDKNHVVQIVLIGSLRRRTQLEKVMEQIGQMPFDQVINAILKNSM